MGIAYVNSWSGGPSTAKSNFALTVATAGGVNHINFVSVSINATTTTVSSVTDSAGNTYTKVNNKTVTNGSTKKNEELWASQVGASAATSITVNTSATDTFLVVAGEYSGVGSLGANVVASGTASPLTISELLTAGNNWIVAALGHAGSTANTATSGTLRKSASNGAGTVVGALMDNTAASASSVTGSCTTTTSAWAAVAVELQQPSSTISATLAATEAPDALVSAAAVKVAAAWASTEGADIFSAAGTVGNASISGTLAATEAPDSLAAIISLVVSAALAANESPDIFQGVGDPVMSITVSNVQQNHRALYWEYTGDGTTTASSATYPEHHHSRQTITAKVVTGASNQKDNNSGGGGLKFPSDGTAVTVSAASISGNIITVTTSPAVGNGVKAFVVAVLNEFTD